MTVEHSTRRRACTVARTLAAAFFIAACGDYSPTTPYVGTTASAVDLVGDTYGGGTTKWDLTGLTLSRDASAVTVRLDFASTVISPTSGDTTAMIGFVDLDTDQDSSTGLHNTIDPFRPPGGGATELGADYQLILKNYDADSNVAIKNAAGAETGRVKPVFDGTHLTIRIPLTMLGNDDGLLSAAAIVGNVHQPSDIVPDNGHLTLGANAEAHTIF